MMALCRVGNAQGKQVDVVEEKVLEPLRGSDVVAHVEQLAAVEEHAAVLLDDEDLEGGVGLPQRVVAEHLGDLGNELGKMRMAITIRHNDRQ